MGPGAFDRAVLDFMVERRTPFLTDALGALGRAGTTTSVLVVVILVAAVVVVVLRAYRTGAAVAGGVVVAWTIAKVAKEIIARPRPAETLQVVVGGGYAFPSTHAAFTSAAAAALITVVAWRTPARRRLAAGLAVVGVAFVGLAMVYLGSHWALDVLAGWLLGTPIGVAAGRLARARPRRPEVSPAVGAGQPAS